MADELNKFLERDLGGDNPRLIVKLDELFGTLTPNNSEFRQAVGQAIIDKIRERTLSNTDRKNGAFPDYSPGYAASIEFKAYGKEKSDPNLKLTGDMLTFLDIVDEDKDAITIGWNDNFQAAKAHGHITGSVGKKRDFLGLPVEDLRQIARDMRGDLLKAIEDTPEGVTLSTQRTQSFVDGSFRVQKKETVEQLFKRLFGG